MILVWFGSEVRFPDSHQEESELLSHHTSAGSGAQALATAGPPGLHDPSAALGGHPGAETVTALAHELARLVRPFHESLSAIAACRR